MISGKIANKTFLLKWGCLSARLKFCGSLMASFEHMKNEKVQVGISEGTMQGCNQLGGPGSGPPVKSWAPQ